MARRRRRGSRNFFSRMTNPMQGILDRVRAQRDARRGDSYYNPPNTLHPYVSKEAPPQPDLYTPEQRERFKKFYESLAGKSREEQRRLMDAHSADPSNQPGYKEPTKTAEGPKKIEPLYEDGIEVPYIHRPDINYLEHRDGAESARQMAWERAGKGEPRKPTDLPKPRWTNPGIRFDTVRQPFGEAHELGGKPIIMRGTPAGDAKEKEMAALGLKFPPGGGAAVATNAQGQALLDKNKAERDKKIEESGLSVHLAESPRRSLRRTDVRPEDDPGYVDDIRRHAEEEQRIHNQRRARQRASGRMTKDMNPMDNQDYVSRRVKEAQDRVNRRREWAATGGFNPELFRGDKPAIRRPSPVRRPITPAPLPPPDDPTRTYTQKAAPQIAAPTPQPPVPAPVAPAPAPAPAPTPAPAPVAPAAPPLPAPNFSNMPPQAPLQGGPAQARPGFANYFRRNPQAAPQPPVQG